MASPQVDPEVAEARRMVAAEMERFRAALPGLLEDDSLRGRWVVFKDGEVAFVSDERTAAYDEAYRRFGYYGGAVIAPVEPERVHRLGGAGFRLAQRRS